MILTGLKRIISTIPTLGLRLTVKNFFKEGHERTLRARKNIFASFFIKGGSILIGLVMVPMIINYINPTQFGVWLTLSSIITWLNFFNIGLDNGLRNKLAAANASKDHTNTKIYISTTYAILAIISALAIIIFFFISPFINWQHILKIGISNENLKYLVFILLCFFCIQLIVQTINVVLTANHEPAKTSLINLIGQVICIIVLFVLIKTTHGSLLNLVFVLAGIPPVIILFAGIWLYRNNYKMYAPSFKLVRFKYARELLTTGGVFFIIQIGALILYQTDNIIITRIFEPKEVTTFNIGYRLFSIVTMIFSIIITPFWSAYTDAYTKKDFEWIKSTLKKSHRICILLSILATILLFASQPLYNFWVGSSIKVPNSLSVAFCIYIIAYMWYAIHVYLLNGIGKIKLQLYMIIAGALINVPLSFFLGSKIGLAGVTLANAIVFALMGVFVSIQCKKILNNTAENIWNK